MNSAFSWDTFLDTQVAFLGFPHIPGTCTAFLHVVGLCYFRYIVIKLCVYILQMLLKFRIFLGHLCGHGVVVFGFWYILKMLQKFNIFPGHLPRHRGFFFRVFRTLHHVDALYFLGTFTWTQGLFFSGVPDTTSCRFSGFSQDIYLDTGACFFSGFCTSCRCSGNSAFSWDIYVDMGLLFLGFGTS